MERKKKQGVRERETHKERDRTRAFLVSERERKRCILLGFREREGERHRSSQRER